MILQIKRSQSCEVVTDIITQTKKEYNFKQNQDIRISSVKTVYHGSERIPIYVPKFMGILPGKINEFSSLRSFKKEIRNWLL